MCLTTLVGALDYCRFETARRTAASNAVCEYHCWHIGGKYARFIHLQKLPLVSSTTQAEALLNISLSALLHIKGRSIV